MKWFNDMKIRSKILIGFTIVSIICFFTGFMVYSEISKKVYDFTFVMSIIGVCIAVSLGLLIANSISKSIIELLGVAKKISSGDMNIKIERNTKDEVGELSREFIKVVNSIKGLITDSNSLKIAAIEGQLGTRADETKHNGAYKEIIQDVNKTIDALTAPIYESKKVLSNMAVNDLTIKMTGSYEGMMKEFAEDINSVNSRIASVVKLNTEISLGDISGIEEIRKIGRRSENDKLMPTLVVMMTNIKNLIEEVNSISDAAIKGDLEVRGDESKFQGGYSEVIQGFNRALSAIAEPINESKKVLESMALNDLTIKMPGSYEGVMKELADNINSVNGRISSVSDLLTQASVGDTSRLDDLNRIGRRSENDKLMPAMILMMSTIQNLIKEISDIADGAIEGNLETRSETSKFKGGFRDILEGINKTLDAVTEPITESRKVLSKMALNDLTMTMTGAYKGTMKNFAEDINSVHSRITAVVKLLIEISVGDTKGLDGLISVGKRSDNDKLMPSMIVMMTTIQDLIKEAGSIADSAVAGNLEVRGDVSKFHGGYREVLEGFNNTLDAVEAPINESAQVLKEMSSGNLCVSMNGDYQGSYKIIKDSLNSTLEAFNELLGGITDASEEVSSGSNQVSDGSQALSQGTTEQASAIEQLTSSITEVAAQTKQNAVNASQANELALSAKEGAILGNSHMKDMLKSMEEINESSSNISKIIKVIDDIAFQTNMLALNAAVEAARAGQHGKGFAVVAEEVRNLAARSANAAKETTDLVAGSIKKVEFGTKIANNTAESLDQIVLGVAKAATLVGEIAAASNEQATAIYQINKGIEQVSDVVQTNSATAEESAAASEELSGQASMLKSMVEKFKLKRGNTVSRNEVHISKKVVTKIKPKISLSNTDFGKY